MPSREQADVLLTKAGQDEYFVDTGLADELIGFHAQQAIEKTLKAVLASASIRYPPTHDLVKLIELVRRNDFDFPGELEEIRALSPYAGVLRYILRPRKRPLDRQWALNCIRKTRAWAQSILTREPKP